MPIFIAVITYDDLDGGIFDEVVKVLAQDLVSAKEAARMYAEHKSAEDGSMDYDVAKVVPIGGIRKITRG